MIHHYCEINEEESLAVARSDDYRLVCASCRIPVATSNGVRYEAPEPNVHVCGLCGLEFYSKREKSRNIHERREHSWDRYLDDKPPETALRAIDAQTNARQTTLSRGQQADDSADGDVQTIRVPDVGGG